MMITFDNFYKSKEWEALRAILIQQRTAEDGILYCAQCGKPILKRYDCIAHHKIELTPENVGDADISLNPDNIELIHFKCHNKQHERFSGLYQRVYLVYGSPCSGKTSWVDEVANGDDLILDVDRIWDCLCNDGRYKKVNGKSKRPHRIRQNVFAVRDSLIEQIKTRRGQWRNAYIIGGYPLRTDRDRLCELLQAEPIYIDATEAECLKRAETERPEEWQEYIKDWFQKYIP